MKWYYLNDDELRLFSDYNNIPYLLFSKKEEEDKKSLKNYKSNRGFGRAFVLSGLNPAVPIVLAATKCDADTADWEGKSDTEILRRATKTGAIYGTAFGAFGNALSNLTYNGKITPQSVMTSSALGALGGALGSRKNTKERLNKRLRKLSNRYKDDD